MTNTKFTQLWNIARFVAIAMSFIFVTIFSMSKAHAHGFAPTLDVTNTEDRDHQELDRREEDRRGEAAYDKWNNGSDCSSREVQDAQQWEQTHTG